MRHLAERHLAERHLAARHLAELRLAELRLAELRLAALHRWERLRWVPPARRVVQPEASNLEEMDRRCDQDQGPFLVDRRRSSRYQRGLTTTDWARFDSERAGYPRWDSHIRVPRRPDRSRRLRRPLASFPCSNPIGRVALRNSPTRSPVKTNVL